MSECFDCLSEAERIQQRIQRLKNERDCLRLTKDIYRYIERYPERIQKAGIKQITITPAQSFEAKLGEEEKK